jgi:hypothetical protein
MGKRKLEEEDDGIQCHPRYLDENFNLDDYGATCI